MERHYLARSPESERIIKVVEVSGDLGKEAARHATQRGMRVLRADPSGRETLTFAPLEEAHG